jgi:hypothetical protein
MQTRYLLFSVIPMLFITCCDKSSESAGLGMKAEEYMMAEAPQADASAEVAPVMRQFSKESSPAPLDNTEPAPERKIIRDGDISFETEDILVKKSQVDSLIKMHKAYLSSESFYDNPGSLDYNLSVRIPAENYDLFITALEKGPGRILNKNIRARDVTEEYYDVKTRLNSKKEVEKRYLEILGRAYTVKDILEIEEKLGRIREEIESTEGRLRLLENQIGYSTLNIWLTQPKDQKYEPADRPAFWQRLVETLHKGWLGLLNFILIFLRLWPLWIVGIILWRLIVMLIRRKKKSSSL